MSGSTGRAECRPAPGATNIFCCVGSGRRWPDRPAEIVRTSNGYMSGIAAHNSRTPGGHPEGYIEAFANLYRNFALALQSILAGEEPAPETLDFPSAEDGVRGMRFIETIVATGSTENKWIKIID